MGATRRIAFPASAHGTDTQPLPSAAQLLQLGHKSQRPASAAGRRASEPQSDRQAPIPTVRRHGSRIPFYRWGTQGWERINDSPNWQSQGFKPRSVCLCRIQMPCVFCCRSCPRLSQCLGLTSIACFFPGAFILQLEVCQEAADAGGRRVGRAVEVCALLSSFGDLKVMMSS